MVDSFSIYTSSVLTDDDFAEEIVAMGGEVVSGDCLIQAGDAALWPAIDNSGLEIDDPATSETKAAMARLVNAPLRTCVVVDICSSPGSRTLAGRFLDRFASRHACVVNASTCCPRVLLPEEASAELREDRSLLRLRPEHRSQLKLDASRRWFLR